MLDPMTASRLLLVALPAAFLVLVSSLSSAAAPSVDDDDRVVLHGNVHPLARAELDAGPAPAGLPMQRMILTLRLRPGTEADLQRLLVEQQDPASPNFHRWLTPAQFGARFGATSADIARTTAWLAAHGLTVERIAQGRTWIDFSGTAADVGGAFRTEIHDFVVARRRHHANVSDPTLPRALAPVVAGVVSLHDFGRHAAHRDLRPLGGDPSQPDYTSSSGGHYLAPGDFTTIYDVDPLYQSGIDGTGEAVAIVGRTHPPAADWSTFRSYMGLPDEPLQLIVNGPDPGDLGTDEDSEADLDVEWAGAVARNATIVLVVSASTAATDGVDLSAQYIVDNDVAPVMSTSFTSCEQAMGTSENAFWSNLWSQAAAEGITSLVASGDSGASGCDAGSTTTGSGAAVNGLASTPYDVAVGGTQFDEGTGSFWSATNSSDFASATGYIPEDAWNESGSAPSCPPGDACEQLWSSGGGRSTLYHKPSWQVAAGVPADGKRDVPDVALNAAGSHDGYLLALKGQFYAIGGTSAASPSFAGLVALAVQRTGQRQGNANPRLYQLGAAQYGSTGASVFHDILAGSNTVPGVSGFACGTGYDLATGLGSVDAHALVDAWVAASVGTPTPTATPTATATPAGGASATPTSSSFPPASATPMSTVVTSTPTPLPIPVCAATPESHCSTPLPLRPAGVLSVVDQTLGNRETLSWTWLHGPSTTVADFGDPLTTDAYELCMYDGSSSLVMHAVVPAGGLCPSAVPTARSRRTVQQRPCWTETSTGFRYHNNAAAPLGVTQLLLRAGSSPGTARISLSGRGVNLEMPLFPLAQPLIVQLQNSSGRCWSASYTPPAQANTAGPPAKFRAKADVE